MIFNLYTVILLFISVLTGILSIFIIFLSLRLYGGYNVVHREITEQRSYLLLLIALVVLVIKIVAWPLFYFTLWSYIPYVLGAMCIFGVTQVERLLSGIVQVYKPLVFFFIIAWLFLHRLDAMTYRGALFRRKIVLLSILGIIILVDSVLDFVYLMKFNPDIDVSCCTTFFDLPSRETLRIATGLFGSGYRKTMVILFSISNAALLSSYILAMKRYRFKIIFLTLFLSILNSIITVLAFFEIFSPIIMDIPGHHCIYCMWQYRPLSIIMSLLFVFATFVPGWATFINVSGRMGEAKKLLPTFTRRLYLYGIIALLAYLLLLILLTLSDL